MRDVKPKTTRKYRKISPYEWIYLSATAQFPPFAIQLRIAVESLPPLSSLEEALAVAAQANPGARLTAAGGWWLDSGEKPPVRVVPASESFSLSHPYFHEAFSFNELPPIEVLYWHGCGLVFRCSHALMDAVGLLFFAQETFRALRGEPLLGTSGKISDYEYLKALNHPKTRPPLRPDKSSPLGAPTSDGFGFIWEHRFIPGQVASVGARLAAVLGSMTPRGDRDRISRIMLPVDLRQSDPSLRTTGNLSNALFLERPAASGWTEYYRDILEGLGRHDERAVFSLDALFPWIPKSVLRGIFRWRQERQVRNDRYLFSAMISHVGPISLSGFSAPGCIPAAVALLPFDVPGSAITLITAQHDKGLEIGASSPAATGREGRLGAVLDLLCAELGHGRSLKQAAIRSQAAYEPREGSRVLRPDLTVYALFAQQARIHPERVALSEEGRRLSYGELHRLTAACAYRLQQQGVAPGDKVAVLAERRTESVIALLGILRLGASFVPLDPDWPRERIRFVLSDCRPTCLLTDEAHAGLADPAPSLMLSELMELSGSDDLRFEPSSQTPAYVLYTSGSTGKPKGVVVGQASLLNYLLWAEEAYLADMDAPIVFPFFTPLVFDLTLTSIFLPLAIGGEIRVFPQRDALLAIRAILSDSGINAAKLTPSHLRLFAAHGIGKSGLRKMIVGGEALPARLASEIDQQSAGRAEIFNEYGPTEATIGCVVHRFEPERDIDAFVPIGIPIANTEVLLLDENAIPVADGEPGEIYLAGTCLALGYLARPEEDARFAAHPFRAGTRAYRTGDRARRLPDGRFDYLGRIDDQVKILGHRVELGEIDAAIEASNLCRAYAVLPEEFANGTRLAAFVTWRQGACEADLHRALIEALPTYMIPSRIVVLEDMPLNVNGKVDKARLPVGRPLSRRETTVSSDGMEEGMREIVSDLTEQALASVPPDESLLDLGLDSLQMMMLLTLSANRFLPEAAHERLFSDLEEFIREPTLQSLARHLRKLTPGQEAHDQSRSA